MPSRLVDDKKRYLYSVYIGKKPETFWGKVRWYITAPLRKWNLAKLECMQEKLATWDEKHKVAIVPSERDVRRAIRELRELGFNIASSSDHKGYWIGDETARQRTIKEYRSRAAALLEVADKLEKGPDIGQMEMEL